LSIHMTLYSHGLSSIHAARLHVTIATYYDEFQGEIEILTQHIKPELITWNEAVATQLHVGDDEIFQNLLHNEKIAVGIRYCKSQSC
jgi:hypothetical protein